MPILCFFRVLLVRLCIFGASSDPASAPLCGCSWSTGSAHLYFRCLRRHPFGP